MNANRSYGHGMAILMAIATLASGTAFGATPIPPAEFTFDVTQGGTRVAGLKCVGFHRRRCGGIDPCRDHRERKAENDHDDDEPVRPLRHVEHVKDDVYGLENDPAHSQVQERDAPDMVLLELLENGKVDAAMGTMASGRRRGRHGSIVLRRCGHLRLCVLKAHVASV